MKMKLKDSLQSSRTHAIAYALLRGSIGILLTINGCNTWQALHDGSIQDFPDPIGVGSEFSLYLVIFAELICGLAIALGLFTRLASLPVMMTFIVAVFLVHGNDPFDVKQPAILYLVASLYFIVKGSGIFSLDRSIAPYLAKKEQRK